jgi:hypothetical protein
MAAYFEPVAAGLMPVAAARSPWAPDMLHGRLLAGLAARAVEAAAPHPEFRLARLTVDMFKSPPMAPLAVATALVRDGRRVKAVDVSMAIDGIVVGRASALVLRTGPHPESPAWQPDYVRLPAPDRLPFREGFADMGGWDLRMVSEGGFATADRKRVWARDTWELVEGEPLTPLVRAALAADLPNPLANSGGNGLRFINADLTLYLGRLPVSDWIGLEVADHQGADGVAVGSCTMFDTEGPVGWSSVCAVANPQGMSPGAT